MVVNVHLHEFDAPPGRSHCLLKGRLQLLARATPWCPEIDQNRLVAGFLDDVGRKTGGGCVLNRRELCTYLVGEEKNP